MRPDLPYILVHRRPSACPKAEFAIEITERFAERIKRDGFCISCGDDALMAVPKANEERCDR